MYIRRDSQYVGFGTNNPQYKLHVEGPIYSSAPGGIGYFLPTNSAIRTTALSGGTIYIDSSNNLTGTIYLRANTNDLSNGTTETSLLGTKGLRVTDSFVYTGGSGMEFGFNSNVGGIQVRNRTSNVYYPLSLVKDGGNLLIGTSTDTGLFKVDVNGSLRAINATIGVNALTDILTLNAGINQIGLGVTTNTFNSANTYFNNQYNYLRGNVILDDSFGSGLPFWISASNPAADYQAFRSILINSTVAQASGTVSNWGIDIRPTLNFTSGYTGTYYGIDYNPFILSASGLTHVAYRNTSGDIIHGNLAGTGIRMVVADSSGKLLTQSIPTGNTGSVTTVSAGTGMSFSNITTSGSVSIDTNKVPFLPSGFTDGFLYRDGSSWIINRIIPAKFGGTGQSGYTFGDILYASGPNTLTKLSAGTTGRILHTGDGVIAPYWSLVSLFSGVTGNLPVTNLNNGTDASNTTFWRGDGTWVTPPNTTYESTPVDEIEIPTDVSQNKRITADQLAESTYSVASDIYNYYNF